MAEISVPACAPWKTFTNYILTFQSHILSGHSRFNNFKHTWIVSDFKSKMSGDLHLSAESWANITPGVISFFSWTTLYFTLCILNSKKSYEYHVRLVTTCHAVLVCTMAGWSGFVLGPWPFTDPGRIFPFSQLLYWWDKISQVFDIFACKWWLWNWSLLQYREFTIIFIFINYQSILQNGVVSGTYPWSGNSTA